jgi:hypothetical protein
VSPLRSAAGPVGHAACAALVALVLLAVAQPLFTDDAWWHLALGREFARHGPWLADDPLLHGAAGPAAPASWLADVALDAALRAGGFTGLRVAHGLVALAILAVAWSLLRRAGGSALAASLGTALFATLAAYRLVQLRPHLLTILATLLLYRLLLEDGAPPTRRRVALAVALLALWANAHAGFLLGPVLLAAGLGGLALATPLRDPAERRRDATRGARLAVALALGALATLANPSGAEPHLAWFVAGSRTPALLRVADEWVRVDPLHWPAPGLPPSPLSWAIVWGLLLGSGVVLGRWLSRRRSAADRAGDAAAGDAGVDPALAGVAVASLAALLTAVRFLWLGIFPLLLILRATRGALAPGRRPSPRLATAGAALLLLPAFVHRGDWSWIGSSVPGTWRGWARPYHADKYHAQAVWLLADAGLEGNLFNDYGMGGFLGFWLAPQLRASLNGTLNVSSETMDANRALRQRRGAQPGESFLELLDRLGIDLFVGIRLPRVGPVGRPWEFTTGHLEGAPGWLPVFRNLTSAVYLRTNARNEENLRRVSRYYAQEGVPFDPSRGFDPEGVIREALDWAVVRGVVPIGFESLATSASVARTLAQRAAVQGRLASVYAALGLYERAVRVDRRLLRHEPDVLAVRRRLVWSLLRLGRVEEAALEAQALRDAPGAGPLALAIAEAALRAATLDDPEERSGLVARLPLFTPLEARLLLADVAGAEPRPPPY